MRQDALKNRERILVAAEEVFGAQGAAGSTEEIARLAGVGIATVFRHFPTKEALVEAVLLRHFDEITDRARALAREPDADAAWQTLVRTMVGTGLAKARLAAMITEGLTVPDSAIAAAERLKAVVDEVLKRAQAAGTVRPSATVEEVYFLLRALAQAQLTLPTSQETVASAVDILLTGLSVAR